MEDESEIGAVDLNYEFENAFEDYLQDINIRKIAV